MSAIDTKQVWSSISSDNLDSKYEKCRNITEEIYKRINITFQIKKLETGTQSDDSNQSDAIDSNETDLFACDKSSISSSTEPSERRPLDKYININNNEELAREKKAPVTKRPRKRFRKRVKKRQPAAERSDSDASSDSALPLSRMVAVDAGRQDGDSAREGVMGVPNIIIITKDFKSRIKTPEPKPKHDPTKEKTSEAADKAIDKDVAAMLDPKEKTANLELKPCTMCSLSFKGEKTLRRHMNMTHVFPEVKYGRDGTPA